MATKSDFTAEEWEVLQWAVTDTMTYLSMADRGFWDTFGKINAAAKYITAARSGSDNLLVRDLAGDVKTGRDKEATQNPTDMAGEVAERISQAAAIIGAKAPDDTAAFKAFILGVARATAEASKGVADNEAKAIENIERALG